MIEMKEDKKRRKKLKRKFSATAEDDLGDDEDLIEARRRIFGDESSYDSNDSQCNKDKEGS